MTGTALGKQIEEYYAHDPRVWFIRTNVNRKSKFIKGLPLGFSDLMALLKDGRTLFIETKSLKEEQRKDQKDFQARVNKLGFKYIIARSLSDVEAALLCK